MDTIVVTIAGVYIYTYTSNLINKNKKINITKSIAVKPINI